MFANIGFQKRGEASTCLREFIYCEAPNKTREKKETERKEEKKESKAEEKSLFKDGAGEGGFSKALPLGTFDLNSMLG